MENPELQEKQDSLVKLDCLGHLDHRVNVESVDLMD